MKKLLWTSAMALTAVACLTACDETSSSSYEIPSYNSDTALPDTCSMEVAKVDTSYFACFENKWVEVTDSATVEQLKEGLDEDEIKAKIEELQSLLVKPADNTPKPASSSAQSGVEGSGNEGDANASSEDTEESSGKSKKKKDKDKDDSEGGSGSGESGSGTGEETEKKCGDVTYDPKTQICGAGDKILEKCGKSGYDPETQYCKGGTTIEDMPQCGTEEGAPLYNPEKQYCTFNGKNVKDMAKCGSANYNPEYEYCASETIHTKLVCCGGSPMCKSVTLYENSPDFFYNPETHFCSDDYRVLGKCGDETYDPKTHYCMDESLYLLAEAVTIAAKAGDVTMLEELADLGAPLEERDTGTEGFFPIHWAVKSGKVEAVQFFINKGVDVNAKSSNGWSVLDWATNEGYTQIIKALKKAGAKNTAQYIKDHRN